MTLRNILFGFSGRLNRAKFWLALLVTLAMWVVGIYVATALRSVIEADAGLTVAAVTGLVVLAVGSAASIAAGVRRLHDREKSGWWLLLLYGVPSVLYGCFSVTMLDGLPPAAIMAIAFAVQVTLPGMTVWAVIELGCLQGTAGPNAYGADPLLRPAAA